ncbi:MAG TPA: glycosyltransferase family 2 protein [Pseudolysinimonas sp.]
MPVSVSVALCTRNGERHIEEQLHSIFAQSPPVDQLVIADDASTDGTVALVERLLAEAPGVDVVLLQSDRVLGVTANFARALEQCSGELILLCDQDDRWHPNRVAVALARFEANSALLLLHSDADLVNAGGAPLGRTLFESLKVRASEFREIESGWGFQAYLRRNLVTGATTALRSSLLRVAMPLPGDWLHDEWLAIVAAAVGFVAIERSALIDYRQHGNNVVGVNRPTLRYRVDRMLQPRSGRYQRLAARANELVTRLSEISASEAVQRLAAEKAEFERVRAGYPTRRLARIPKVLGQWVSGRYRRLSSQRSFDVVRDIVQRGELP